MGTISDRGKGRIDTLELSKELTSQLDAFLDDPLDDDDDRYFRGVIFGGPGGGKTVAGARLCDPNKKMVVFDAEDGSTVLSKHVEGAKGDLPKFFKKGQIERHRFPGLMEVAYMANRLDPDEYDLVMIDSITSCDKLELFSIMQNVDFNRKNPVGAQLKPTLEDYGLRLSRWQWMIDMMSNLPLSLVMIGHVEEPSDLQIANGRKRGLFGTDKLETHITSRVGNALLMEAETTVDPKTLKQETTRYLQTLGDKKLKAKNRLGLPMIIGDDDFVNFFHEWRS